MTIKCKKCKTELVGKDLVEVITEPIWINSSLRHMPCLKSRKFRCPKCFTIKKVNHNI